MKKICTIVGIVFVLMAGAFYMTNKDSSPDCVSSVSANDDYYLTIIANQRKFEDKEAFANQLIELVKNNGFATIMFSFEETGYPTSLNMTVYLTEKDREKNNVCMTVSLRQENWEAGKNIIEHYDEFKLEISE